MAKSTSHHRKPVRKNRAVRYQVQNWPEYERALAQRGSLTVWFDARLLKRWRRTAQPTAKRGAPYYYQPALLVCMLTLKALYHLSNREVEGLTRSLLALLQLPGRVPDHTTLSRRGRHLAVPLRRWPPRGPVQLLLDSSGLQIHGAGPWRSQQTGYWRKPRSHRQAFRKLHVALNAETHEFLAVELTDQYENDNTPVDRLLKVIPARLAQVTADGSYDFDNVYKRVRARGARAIIPPRVNAAISPYNPRPDRDAAIRWIRHHGSRRAWKKKRGYHRRSLIETAFSRLKRRLGPRLASREQTRQITEARIWCQLLNRLTHLGMPDTLPIRLT
jgi:IS5 family transposase